MCGRAFTTDGHIPANQHGPLYSTDPLFLPSDRVFLPLPLSLSSSGSMYVDGWGRRIVCLGGWDVCVVSAIDHGVFVVILILDGDDLYAMMDVRNRVICI